MSVGFSSCLDIMEYDDCVDTPQPDESPWKVLAIRVYDSSIFGSRATRDGEGDEATPSNPAHDSDFGDETLTDESNNSEVFNKGLASEKAIFTGYTAIEESPHFLLFFENDQLVQANQLTLSEWDFSQGDETDPEWTSYRTLFAIQNGNLPQAFNTGMVLIVLNASEAVQVYLRSKLSEGSTSSTYNEIRSILVGSTVTGNHGTSTQGDEDNENGDDDSSDQPSATAKPSPIDFLFYTADDGTKYFTMTSSMVVKDNKIMPAFTGDFENGKLKWYPSKELAEKNPSFSMYVERMQSKYTLLFKKNGETYYFDPENPKINQKDKNGYIPVDRLVYTYDDTKKDFTLSKVITFEFVKKYDRSQSVTNRKEVEIESSTNWKVNITGWGINAMQKHEYLFKNLKPNINYYDLWNPNKYSAYRNFWAEDPDYTNINRRYPDQYRSTIDDPDPSVTPWVTKPAGYTDPVNPDVSIKLPAWGIGDNNTLNYFSYEDLASRTPHHYSPENTFHTDVFSKYSNLEKAYESKAYLRAGTHVIVTAQLLIKGFDPDNIYAANKFGNYGLVEGDTPDDYSPCKLYMNGLYWSEDAYKEYVGEYLAYWLLSDDVRKKYDIPNNDGNLYVAPVADIANRPLAYARHFQLEAVNIEGGDNYVRITPRKDSSTTQAVHLYVYDLDSTNPDVTERYVEVTDVIDKLSKEHPEYFAIHYRRGTMYYAIPVKHNVRSESNGTIAVGDFGAVRNHWYEFTVTNINGLGTGVDNAAQMIIPNGEPFFEGLGVNVSIREWHEINSGGVDIGGQRQPAGAEDPRVNVPVGVDPWGIRDMTTDF